jgi:hypothetical protein
VLGVINLSSRQQLCRFGSSLITYFDPSGPAPLLTAPLRSFLTGKVLRNLLKYFTISPF